MQRIACTGFYALAFLLLVGCAAAPAKRDPRDPWERMNRATYTFNDHLDRSIARPIASAYHKVTPHAVQTGVSNFVDNFSYPVTILNGLLQGKFKQAAQDTGRLLVNTTVGIGGLFDPASKMGLDKNDEDFGITLGKWGIPPGPYLVIPFLGFSSVRDGVGRIGNFYANPATYIKSSGVSWGLWGVQLLDTRARLLGTDQILNEVYDPYAFTRNAYLQRRQYQVTGGQETEDQFDDRELIKESGDDSGDSSAAPKDAPPKDSAPKDSAPPAPPPKP
jgi:phospholipid-binding lipoprotein MlaA